jgi:hypothetical protein
MTSDFGALPSAVRTGGGREQGRGGQGPIFYCTERPETRPTWAATQAPSPRAGIHLVEQDVAIQLILILRSNA